MRPCQEHTTSRPGTLPQQGCLQKPGDGSRQWPWLGPGGWYAQSAVSSGLCTSQGRRPSRGWICGQPNVII